MNILAKDFTAKSLLHYAFPTVLMMVFMSTYTIVDGLFIANLVGEDALSAVNIVMPSLNVLFAIGLMFATGATAVMGRLMGEKRSGEARSFLSVIYFAAIVLGLFISIVGFIFSDYILRFLGTPDELFDYSEKYFIVLLPFCVSFFLQVFTQSFFVLAGKPIIGFMTCVIGGVTNIILDYIFISPDFFNMGIMGAGLATGIGNSIPAVFGLVYFLYNKKGTLYFEKPLWNKKHFFGSMFNGMSEFVSQISTAVTTLLFNMILLNLVGKSGVASVSVILYIQMIQTAIYFGYIIGVAPIISYKYGAKDTVGLKKVLKISFRFIAIISVAVILGSLLFDDIAVSLFIQQESATFEPTKDGFRLFSIAYFFMGINIFMSGMFTSLSDGKVSAILSLARTLVFLVASLLTLPILIGITGVWLAVPVAELAACVLCMYFYKGKKLVYGY